MLLVIAAVTVPGLSFAQMSEQAQERIEEKAQGNMTKAQEHMPEQTQQGMSDKADTVLSELDNFGVEVSNFVHDAMNQFREQRQETLLQIKQCREDMMNAEPGSKCVFRIPRKPTRLRSGL